MSGGLRWVIALAVALAVALVAELAAGVDHPALMPAFGFAGCILLIAVAKGLGGLLARPEGTRAGSHEEDAGA